MEDKLGRVRTPQHNMGFRTFPAPAPAAQRPWVTVPPFLRRKQSGDSSFWDGLGAWDLVTESGPKVLTAVSV